MRDTTRFLLVFLMAGASAHAGALRGTVLDGDSGRPIAARVYLANTMGKYFHVDCPAGSAVPYAKRRDATSFEIHTTVSAHPFVAQVPAGQYTLIVEKGKEYFPVERRVQVSDTGDHTVEIRLHRWTNMAHRGWFSGETHVHRAVSELPTLQLAEDINVAFPLTAWVTDSTHTPAMDNKSKLPIPPARLVNIDSRHVFWPVNTEYEIFTVRRKRHTLGAVFILNHKKPFHLAVPPVGPVATEARQQGGFLELDKHNWPWSMMLVPQMQVELFELANNHMWKTEFLYSDWYPEYAAEYMGLEMVDGQFTERSWMNFGFENYYALLNCGFKMQPTAGTASGVHPVPFGYGRVYVQIDGQFSYDKWVKGLLAGNSFVTTGPMLTCAARRDETNRVTVSGQLDSATSPISIEILKNGRVAKTIDSQPIQLDSGAFRVEFETSVELNSSSWVAVRAFTNRSNTRVSFAHTAPVHFSVADKPLRPTREQRNYLASRVRNELMRSRSVISESARKEFESALDYFETLQAAD